ncbi:MAG: PRD domain-containing protein [Oscillospiraceae bacterium]
MQFGDDEAANIALHLVNAEFENTLSETIRITTSLHYIMTLLSSTCDLNLETGSVFYNELTGQLRFLVFRAFDKALYSRGDPAFVNSVRKCFPKEFTCAQKIAELVDERCGAKLPQEEPAFLAVSLRRSCQEHV